MSYVITTFSTVNRMSKEPHCQLNKFLKKGDQTVKASCHKWLKIKQVIIRAGVS